MRISFVSSTPLLTLCLMSGALWSCSGAGVDDFSDDTTGTGAVGAVGGEPGVGGEVGTGGTMASTGGVSASGGLASSGACEAGTNTVLPSVGGSGAGGSTPSTSDVEASFDTLKFVLTQAHCSDASCHNGEAKPTLLADDADLLNILTTHLSEACGCIPLVTPGDPANSALVMMIKEGCGDLPRMPKGCVSEPIEEFNCLPDDYIAAIEQWIVDGAQQ